MKFYTNVHGTTRAIRTIDFAIPAGPTHRYKFMQGTVNLNIQLRY
jgi:hypothetical protein